MLTGPNADVIALPLRITSGPFRNNAEIRFFNPDGTAASVPTIDLGNTGGFYPTITALPGGGLATALWVDPPPGGTSYEVRRWDATGAQVGSATTVTFPFTDFSNTPELLGLPDGGLMVAISGVLPGFTDANIYGQRIAADGSLDGGVVELDGSPPGSFETRPQLALTTDGQVVVVWEDQRSPSDFQIRAARLDLDPAAPDPIVPDPVVNDGTPDADTLDGGSLADSLSGAGGDDLLRGLGGADLLRGEAGADTLEGGEGGDNLRGGAGDDLLRGEGGNDSLYAHDGNDTADGAAGADRVDGGIGDDIVSGGDNDDRLFGGDGIDALDGGAGNDQLFGGAGADTLDGGTEDDRLDGGAGHDQLLGGEGRDRLFGGDDEDMLAGAGGNDQLFGGAAADQLLGGTGDDRLAGDAGDDSLAGEAGIDRLFGGDGADTLRGGADADEMWGGAGADVFGFDTTSDSFTFAADRIRDFEVGLDRLDLSAITGGTGVLLAPGAAFTGAAKELRQTVDLIGNRVTLELNEIGDTDPEMTIILTGTTTPLGAGDVIF